MFNIFPDIMFLGPFFAPVLLRIAAALIFFAIAERLFKHHHLLIQTRFPLIGAPHPFIAWFWVFVPGTLALSFAAGLYTQIAALIGLLVCTKMWFFKNRYAEVLPFGRELYFLLGAVCLTLFITGAGAFAFDLPF
jgi:uncharacterized membrane protein YphA (DoxX/SURF4 family)